MASKQNYLIGITLVATLGGLLFGYDTAVISGAVSHLEAHFIKPLGLNELAANSLLGFLASSALIGCIIGGASAGFISGKYGRRKALFVAGILFFISAIGSTWPETFTSPTGENANFIITLFIIYRIIGGIGVGVASMVSPLYISEIAPNNIRGRLVSLNQLTIVLGILVVYFVNYFIAAGQDESWLNEYGWRYMFLSESVPAGLFILFLLKAPESPRWLLLKDKLSEARAILSKFYHKDGVEMVISDVLASAKKTPNAKVLSFGSLVIIVGILLSVFQQFIGINVVLYYAPEIFKSLGNDSDSSLIQTIIVGVINLLFTIVAIYTVDRLGRRPLMIIGSIVMGFAMIALGTSLHLHQVGVASLLFMLLYIAGFALSWGPVTWVLLSEIFPNSIRSSAMAIAVAAQWIANYIVSATFPILNKNTYLTEHFNHGFSYWLYGLMGLLSAIIVWKIVPETKGKTLEEIEEFWRKD